MNPALDRALADVTFHPFWLDDARQEEIAPPLIGAEEADLAIVGGGFTGLWAAIMAKEARPDRDVALIERDRIAHGASGRPGGIVSTSVMHGLANAARVFPDDLVELERLGKHNLAGFRDDLARFAIDCDAEWTGELIVGIGEAAAARLQREREARERHGHAVRWLSAEAAQAEIASPSIAGALWSMRDSGVLHPAKLAWGLRRAALGLGVRIYELTPLEEVEDRGASLRLRTASGRLTAGAAVFATNAWAAGHRRIRRYVAAIRDRVLASEPLNAEQRSAIGWRNRQGVYDTRSQLNYMRLTRDDRIVFGGRLGYFFGDDTDAAADRASPANYVPLAGAFFSTFPQLRGLRFTHAWSGPIALTCRMAVHFQRYYGGKGVYVGGYSGFGIGPSRFGARIALAHLDDARASELKLAFARTLPRPIPPEPVRWLGAIATMRALDGADAKGGWRRPWLKLVERLGFPLS